LDGGGRYSEENRKVANLTDRHHPKVSILPNITANIMKENWNQFLLAFTFMTGHCLA